MSVSVIYWKKNRLPMEYTMDHSERQYKQELHNQELKANQRTRKGLLWIFAGVSFFWLLTMFGIFVVHKTSMTIAFVFSAVICIYVWLLQYISKLDAPWIKYALMTVICLVAGILGAFLSFHAVFVYVLPLLFAIQYRQRAVLWFSYAVDGIAMLASMLIGFYYGLCDLNMLLASNHTREWYLLHMTEDYIPIPLNTNVNFVIVVYGFFPRMVILLIFVIMLRYTLISNYDDALRIADLTYRKETDTATKLFNKNKYEEMADSYYPEKPWIAAIFWDVNNLKLINDRFGHSTGDLLLETISARLSEQTDERKRAYRIGGDEFVLLIDNPVPGEPEEIIHAVRAQLKKNHEDGGLKVTSAVGWAEGSGKQIREIVSIADKRMYEDKLRSKQGRDS